MNTEKTHPASAKERLANRWLLLFYDSLLLLLTWFLAFHVNPGDAHRSFLWNAVHFAAAYGIFVGLRMMFHAYKQIWRRASVRTFAREFAALTLASGLFIALCALSRFAPLQQTALFSCSVIVLSLLARFFYYVLYRLLKNQSLRSSPFKTLFSLLTMTDPDASQDDALMRLVLQPAEELTQPVNQVQRIVGQFAIRGTVQNIIPIKKGYINQTYRIETISDTGHIHQYTLQRINTNVFPDVDGLMANLKLTTQHLHGKLILPGRRKQASVQSLRPTKDGRSYLRDDSGCWRMLNYIDDVYSLDIPDHPDTFYHAGQAFGMFVKEMADIDSSEIHTVIPNFHNTRSRYEDLEKVIAKDPQNRAKDVAKEIAIVRARSHCFGLITDALEAGVIPTRICHNDCNLNNILFDNKTHLPVAIIDLDTVMPSSPLYDYGDSMRIGTNTAKDDEKDLSKVSCNLLLYEKYARGYLESFGSEMTREELELLPFASLIITAEDGIRFLMDHIDGDTYYNIYYPGQNLDRARTQLTLLQDMEKKLPQIIDILDRIYGELQLGVSLKNRSIEKKWGGKAA